MTVRANKKKRGKQHRVEQCANLCSAYEIMACEKRNKPSKSQESADVTGGWGKEFNCKISRTQTHVGGFVSPLIVDGRMWVFVQEMLGLHEHPIGSEARESVSVFETRLLLKLFHLWPTQGDRRYEYSAKPR